MEHIYEVVDATDDERYYALGIFLDEQGAMSALDGDAPPYNDEDPEAVTVEVRRRTVGFHPHEHTVIASRTWVRNYEDDKPDWSANPIKLAAAFRACASQLKQAQSPNVPAHPRDK